MTKRILYIIIFLNIFLSPLLAQRLLKLSVSIEGGEQSLSYISRSGNVFVSAKEIAAILGARQYYNSEAIKLDIKFPNNTIKFTGKNQFVVLTEKENNVSKVFQLPVSTLLINDEIFIPIAYSIEYISASYGKKITFDSKDKHLTVLKESSSTETLITIGEKKKETIPEQKTEKPTVSKPASKYDIFSITIEEKTNGTLIRLKGSRKLNIPRHSINNNILYVFFPRVTVSPDITNNIKSAGLVRGVKRTVVSAQNHQLEFSLKEGYSTSEIFRDGDGNDLLISIHNKLLTPQISTETDIKSKWLLDCIVIDAGHGGKDPGAIGITGVREKDINLAVALKLGGLIGKNLPEVKVVYTRKKDEFIELYRRGKIANEAGGKLFISIHCNSMPKKGTSHRGFEVYLLRPGRTQEAIEIAEFENSVIKLEDNPKRYQQLTDENFILVSMAHSQYMRYSENFSDLLNQEWKKGVNIPSLGIKQAGFYVLVGASMPSVLIETGFLSNRTDEAYLASSKGQQDIAQSIFSALKKYKDYYDKAISN